jgi:hypothetical protein
MTGTKAQAGPRSSAGMSPTVGCLISLLVGGAGVACLVVFLQLALRGDISLSRGTPNELRVWLIQEGTNQGLGVSSSHVASYDGGAPKCVETIVRLVLWRSDGSARSITYCDCSKDGFDIHIDGSCPREAP